MPTPAELSLGYVVGDTVKFQITLRSRTTGSAPVPVSLTGATVNVWVSGAPFVCTIDDAAAGKVSFRLNTAIFATGLFPYSIVITFPGGDTQTHTSGNIIAVTRKGG